MGHKIEDGVNYYKIRWFGYAPKDDTWEPESNLLGETTKKNIENFWEEKNRLKEKRLETMKRVVFHYKKYILFNLAFISEKNGKGE